MIEDHGSKKKGQVVKVSDTGKEWDKTQYPKKCKWANKWNERRKRGLNEYFDEINCDNFRENTPPEEEGKCLIYLQSSVNRFVSFHIYY